MHKFIRIRLTKGIRGVARKGNIITARVLNRRTAVVVDQNGFNRYLHDGYFERVFEKCIKL